MGVIRAGTPASYAPCDPLQSAVMRHYDWQRRSDDSSRIAFPEVAMPA